MSNLVSLSKVSKETLEELHASLHKATEEMRGEMSIGFAVSSSATFEKMLLLESITFNEIARRAKL